MLRTLRLLMTRNTAPALAEQSPPATLIRLRQPDELIAPGRPLVSIITVVRNAEDTLEKAIGSVRGQIYPSIEHILVDGASTDGTVAIIRQHLDWIAAWSSESDDGLYDAMNRGIAACTGEIIGILNADDWYSPDLVENAVEELCRSNGDFVFGDIWMYGYRGQDHFLPGDPDYARVVRTDAPRTWHTTMLCRRVMYDRVGLYRTDMRIASDYDWQIRAFRNGFRGIHCPGVVAHVSAGGISTSQQVVALKEGFVCSVSNGYPIARAAIHWGWRWIVNDHPNLGQRAARAKARATVLRAKAAIMIQALWHRLGPARRVIPGKRVAMRLLGLAPTQPAATECDPGVCRGEQRISAFIEARQFGNALTDRAIETLIDRSASWKHATILGHGPAAEQLRALLIASGVAVLDGHATNADLVAVFGRSEKEAEAEARRLGAMDLICKCTHTSNGASVVLDAEGARSRICLRWIATPWHIME